MNLMKSMKNKILVLIFVLVAFTLVLSGCTGSAQRYLGWSGVSFSEDSVYFGSTQGEVISLEMPNGNPNYQEALAGESGGGCMAGIPASIYGTPVYDDGTLYVAVQLTPLEGKVYAINAESGNAKWEFPASGGVSSIIGGAVVSGDVLYFADTAGKIFAVDTGTGSELWSYETGDKIWAKPAINGDLIYVGSFDKKMYALDKATGDNVWEFEAEGAFVAEPLYLDGVVYVGSLDRNMYALDAQSGTLKWKATGESWFWAKPVVYGDALYAPSIDTNVYVLNKNTGDQISKMELDDHLAASPALVGESVIVATVSGKVHAIDVESNAVRLITDLEVRTVAPITTFDGIIYVHTQESEAVYAINPETREVLWTFSIQ